MPKTKAACPKCESHNLKAWVAGKMRCGQCRAVFSKAETLRKEYVPRPRAPRRTAERQEKVLARNIGGRTTIASGSTPVDKGDVKAHDIRGECKFTEKSSYRLLRSDLKKIEAQAGLEAVPILTIQFRGDGPPEEYVIMRKSWFLEFLEAWRDSNDQ